MEFNMARWHGPKTNKTNKTNSILNPGLPGLPEPAQVGAKPNDPRGFWISSLSCRYHFAISCENSGPSLGFSHFLEMQPVDGEFPPVISQDAVSTPGKTDAISTPKL
jgi:hypothetical protein